MDPYTVTGGSFPASAERTPWSTRLADSLAHPILRPQARSKVFAISGTTVSQPPSSQYRCGTFWKAQLPENLRETAARSVVFIGAADARTTNFVDSFPTFFPSRYGAEMSGVELAATAFLNQLEGRELRRLTPSGEAAVIALFSVALSFVALARRRFALLLILGITLLYVFSASEIFSRTAVVLAAGGAGFLCRSIDVRPCHCLEIPRGAHTDHAAGASPDRQAASRSVAVGSPR